MYPLATRTGSRTAVSGMRDNSRYETPIWFFTETDASTLLLPMLATCPYLYRGTSKWLSGRSDIQMLVAWYIVLPR